MATIVMDCPDCKASGLYRGLCEPEGFAVICTNCEGAGKKILEYRPFIGRVLRNDVNIVCWSKNLATRVRTESEGVSYKDFLAGKLPPRQT